MKKQNFKFVRGDDVSYRLTLKNANGSTLDCSNLKFDLHVVVNSSPVIQLSSADDSIIIEEEEGKITLNFAHKHTAKASWTVAQYDLQLTDSQDKRKTIMAGNVQLIHDYTRV